MKGGTMLILGRQGVKPEMKFVCCDCDETTTGQEVIDRDMDLTIVHVNTEDPIKSVVRCMFCQEDKEEQYADAFDDSY